MNWIDKLCLDARSRSIHIDKLCPLTSMDIENHTAYPWLRHVEEDIRLALCYAIHGTFFTCCPETLHITPLLSVFENRVFVETYISLFPSLQSHQTLVLDIVGMFNANPTFWLFAYHTQYHGSVLFHYAGVMGCIQRLFSHSNRHELFLWAWTTLLRPLLGRCLEHASGLNPMKALCNNDTKLLAYVLQCMISLYSHEIIIFSFPEIHSEISHYLRMYLTAIEGYALCLNSMCDMNAPDPQTQGSENPFPYFGIISHEEQHMHQLFVKSPKESIRAFHTASSLERLLVLFVFVPVTHVRYVLFCMCLFIVHQHSFVTYMLNAISPEGRYLYVTYAQALKGIVNTGATFCQTSLFPTHQSFSCPWCSESSIPTVGRYAFVFHCPSSGKPLPMIHIDNTLPYAHVTGIHDVLMKFLSGAIDLLRSHMSMHHIPIPQRSYPMDSMYKEYIIDDIHELVDEAKKNIEQHDAPIEYKHIMEHHISGIPLSTTFVQIIKATDVVNMLSEYLEKACQERKLDSYHMSSKEPIVTFLPYHIHGNESYYALYPTKDSETTWATASGNTHVNTRDGDDDGNAGRRVHGKRRAHTHIKKPKTTKKRLPTAPLAPDAKTDSFACQ